MRDVAFVLPCFNQVATTMNQNKPPPQQKQSNHLQDVCLLSTWTDW